MKHSTMATERSYSVELAHNISPSSSHLYPALPTADNKGSICSYEEVKIFTLHRTEPSKISAMPDIDNGANIPVVQVVIKKPIPVARKKPVAAPRSNSIPHELISESEPAAVIYPPSEPAAVTYPPSVPAAVTYPPSEPAAVTYPHSELAAATYPLSEPAAVTYPPSELAVVTAPSSSFVAKPESVMPFSFSVPEISPAQNQSRLSLAAAPSNGEKEKRIDLNEDHTPNIYPKPPRMQVSKSTDKFGPSGSRQASVRWFKSTQAKFLLKSQDGNEPKEPYIDWFHGIISRKDAETLLEAQPTGNFLVRVGETRLGYTLSFKDESRCRHYMIEYLSSEESFQVVGEGTQHISLLDLIHFYKKNKLTNWEGRLASACPQKEGECDYLELVLTSDDEQLNYICNKPRLEASAPDFDDGHAGNVSWSVGPTPLHHAISSPPPLLQRREPPALHQREAPGPPILLRKHAVSTQQRAVSSEPTVTVASRSSRPLPPKPDQPPTLPPPRTKIH